MDRSIIVMESSTSLNDTSIISDDCWASEAYRKYNTQYVSPTVGLWINSHDYLYYLQHFDELHTETLKFLSSTEDYPIASLGRVIIGFMHALDEQDARESYWRRHARVKGRRIFTKVDFGKPGYTLSDIKLWNELQLENSIAFYPEYMNAPSEGIHNGVALTDWALDGLKMFDITRQRFDFERWIKTGEILRI